MTAQQSKKATTCTRRIGATLNELLTVDYINSNLDYDNKDSLDRIKQSKLTLQKIVELDDKAKIFARYIVANHNDVAIKKAYCTGANYSVSSIINKDVTDKQCPADVIVELIDGSFFGYSLKTSQTTRNNCIGNYSFNDACMIVDAEHAIEYHADVLNNKIIEVAPELQNMTLTKRNKFLKENAKTKEITDALADQTVEKCRDILFDCMTTIYKQNDFAFRAWFNDYFLNSSGFDILNYEILEANGIDSYVLHKECPYERIHEVTNNDLIFEKANGSTITIRTCNRNIIKLRLKYKDRKLTGALNINVEKWY